MEEKQRLLQENYPFWEHLTEAQEERLTAGCQEAVYRKGELVPPPPLGGPVQGGDPPAGRAAQGVYRLRGRTGSDLIPYPGGETCVLSASCLLDAIAFDLMIEAVEDSRALVIPTPALRPVMEENPYVGLYMYRSATERFSDVMWTMQQILFMRIDQRVASFLWDEMLRQGPEIAMTHEEIARLIGSAREVVSKVLKYLAEEGIVELRRGKVRILAKEKLRNIAQKA